MDHNNETIAPAEEASTVAASPAPKKKFKVTESWGYALIMGFVLLLAGQFLGDYITGPIYRLHPSDAMSTCMMYFGFIGIWILILLDMVILKRNRFMLPQLWVRRKGNTIKLFLLGLAAGFAGNMVCVLAALFNGNIHVYFGSVQVLPLLAAFLCVLVQSSAEELVCRCWCYEKILRHHSPGFAILATALFFAGLHLFNNGMSVIPFINIVLVGVLYAMACYYFDSIWLTFAMHTAWNYTQNLLMGLPNSGNVTYFSVFQLDAATATNSWAYDAAFGVEGSVTSLVVHIAAIAALWYFCRNRKPALFAKQTGAEA